MKSTNGKDLKLSSWQLGFSQLWFTCSAAAAFYIHSVTLFCFGRRFIYLVKSQIKDKNFNYRFSQVFSHAHLLQVVRTQTLKVTLMTSVYLIFTPCQNWGAFISISLLLMSKSNKLLSLEMWFLFQRAGTLHYRVDSSLIRKFPHECSCTSQPLSPSVIITAALHEKEGLEIQLTAPYRYLKCNRYMQNCTATSVQCA